MQDKTTQLIPGYHSVKGALLTPAVCIREIWISHGKSAKRSNEISRLGRDRGIPVRLKDTREMNKLMSEMVHQGFAAIIDKFQYTALEDLLDRCSDKDRSSLLIGFDHITDEGNLGGLIRTSAFFGVKGVVLPKDRSARITQQVIKRSSGACFMIPITRVVNMGRALDILSKKGFWIVGASVNSDETIYDFDWNRRICLLLGSEDRGLSLPVKKRCHQLVGIPGERHVESLNVSVAGGVILSEILRQRTTSNYV